MARKVIGLAVGRQGSTRRRWTLLLSLVIAVGAGAVFMQSVLQAQLFDAFELDRNTVDAGGGGEDWNTIYAAQTSGGTTLAGAYSFIADNAGTATDPTIFTGGGSKDDLDVPSWRQTTGSSPDKDELLNGYAARYGDHLYFGADRFAGNGSAQMGIWFFQNEVGPQAGGTFTGAHKDGDVLILSDFTQGGATTTIRVFQWNGPDPTGCTQQQEDDGECLMGTGNINGTLELIGGSADAPADCVGPPAVPTNHPFCATVNATEITVPWPFFTKAAKPVPFKVPGGQFYEGGIDLGAFPHLSEQCFSSFLIETRSSPSVDAVLKDFVGGGFEACESSVVTSPVANGTSTTPITEITLGSSIHDYARITGTGSSDSPTGTMTFYVCAPTELTPANSGTCTDGGTQVGAGPVNVTPIAMSSPAASEAWSAAFTPTVLGKHCFRGEYSGDGTYPAAEDSSAGECFTVNSFPASIETAQTWTVFDTATITAAGGGNLAGNVVFELYTNNTCTGTASFTSAPQAIAGASPQQATSGNYTVSATPGSFTFYWKVIYTSTNLAHRSVTHNCTETASLTYANGSKVTAP